jgi:hypothetical protein
MRIGGWHRLGIVLSIVWAIGGGLYRINEDSRHAEEMEKLTVRICIDKKTSKSDFEFAPCYAKGVEVWRLLLRNSREDIAIFALGPIPLGWAFAYVVIVIWRWVRAGFTTRTS